MLQSRIRRGQMDRQITFIKKVKGANFTNEDELTSWEKVTSNPTVWAKKEQKPGREVVVNEQIQSIVNTTFIVDWRNDIDETMRIVEDSKVFNILTINEHEESRKGFLLLNSESVPNKTWPA